MKIKKYSVSSVYHFYNYYNYFLYLHNMVAVNKLNLNKNVVGLKTESSLIKPQISVMN